MSTQHHKEQKSFVVQPGSLVRQATVRLAYQTHQSVRTPNQCNETSYFLSILSAVLIDRHVVKGPKRRFASEANLIKNYTIFLNQSWVICLNRLTSSEQVLSISILSWTVVPALPAHAKSFGRRLSPLLLSSIGLQGWTRLPTLRESANILEKVLDKVVA